MQIKSDPQYPPGFFRGNIWLCYRILRDYEKNIEKNFKKGLTNLPGCDIIDKSMRDTTKNKISNSYEWTGG